MKTQNYVTFLSPGTFVSEDTTEPIDNWNVDEAVKMAKEILERYSAKPYGFYFTTRGRTARDMDSKELARSQMYYLGGKVFTLEQIKNRNDPKDEILICNMECNKYDRVIVNTNSYKFTAPLNKDDVVLDV